MVSHVVLVNFILIAGLVWILSPLWRGAKVSVRPTRRKVIQKVELAQSWIDDDVNVDAQRSPEPTGTPAPIELRVPTGRSVKALRRGVIFRLEEYAVGDRRFTVAQPVDRRGRNLGELSETEESLDDAMRRIV